MPRGKKNQKDLPGMEDRRLDDLHAKLIELDAVRVQRMKLTSQESELAEQCIVLMEQYHKDECGYEYDGVKAEVVPPDGKKKIKVKIALDPAATEGDPAAVSPQDGADFDEAVQ
jgi:hypothetical protein